MEEKQKTLGEGNFLTVWMLLVVTAIATSVVLWLLR